MSEFQTINKALGNYLADGNTSLGLTNKVYVSIPDSSLTCANLGLPSLPTNWEYRCSNSDNYRKVDSNGWIPVNFTSVSWGSPLPILPIDPVNSTSTGQYYTYVVGGSYKLTALFESEKYTERAAKDGGVDLAEYEIGTNLSLAPFTHGLVGYWKFDEGSGTTASDSSGYGNTGTLSTGASTPGWTTGKVGGALSFDGVDDYVGLPEPPAASTNINTGSVFAWIKTPNAGTGYQGIVVKQFAYGMFLVDNIFGIYDWVSGWRSSGVNLADNLWHFVGFTFENIDAAAPSNNAKLYLDGELKVTVTLKLQNHNEGIVIGAGNNPGVSQFFNGLIDEVRIYNRALSAAEISAIYNATK